MRLVGGWVSSRWVVSFGELVGGCDEVGGWVGIISRWVVSFGELVGGCDDVGGWVGMLSRWVSGGSKVSQSTLHLQSKPVEHNNM